MIWRRRGGDDLGWRCRFERALDRQQIERELTGVWPMAVWRQRGLRIFVKAVGSIRWGDRVARPVRWKVCEGAGGRQGEADLSEGCARVVGMATPLKDYIGAGSVGVLVAAIEGVAPGFPGAAFRAAATSGLAELELKARVAQIAGVLGEHLPGDYPEHARILAAAVGGDEWAGDWWAAWPAVEYAGAGGAEHPEIALETLGRLTGRATAEFAVRPYFDSAPDLAWQYVRGWVKSPDVEQRRLASEGTRPRLPWAPRVAGLVDPARAIPVLDALRGDPEEYVRRSVANHLGDIAKDYPDTALELCVRWRDEGGPHTTKVVRHGLRHLVRLGDVRALELVGIQGRGPATAELSVASAVVEEGEELSFTVTLADAERAEPVLLQYAIADATRRKVYFLAQRDVREGVALTVTRRQRIRHTSTRPLRGGTHTLELIVNGEVRARVPFEVRLA